MFCPKCGAQNAEVTKFCRGCGADLSNVLAVVEGKKTSISRIDEKFVELNSSGFRGVVMGIGFFFIAGLAYAITSSALVITLFALMFGMLVFTTGVSRFVQARGLKALRRRDQVPMLPSDQLDYVKPLGSIYDTDDLEPTSVTERTTNLLSFDEDTSRERIKSLPDA